MEHTGEWDQHQLIGQPSSNITIKLSNPYSNYAITTDSSRTSVQGSDQLDQLLGSSNDGGTLCCPSVGRHNKNQHTSKENNGYANYNYSSNIEQQEQQIDEQNCQADNSPERNNDSQKVTSKIV